MSTDNLGCDNVARWPRPKSIGEYEVVEELGEGAHGVVYKCWDDAIKRDVAIKVLKPTVHSKERHLRIKREGEILGRLSHKNIVVVHASGLADVWVGESAFLVTDYVEGIPIDEFLRGKPISEFVSVLHQLLDGIGHAHREGFVHCDLKPQNLLVTEDGTLKILDFGISKVLCEGFGPLTVDPRDAPFGTPSFMAPEQIERTKVDTRSDLFAVGAVAYLILVGEPPLVPFKTEGWAVYRAIEHGTIKKLKSVAFEFPDQLADAVDRSLNKAPDKRFQTAEEFGLAIERYLDGESVTAHVRRKRMDKMRRVALASLVLGLIGLGAFLMARNSERQGAEIPGAAQRAVQQVRPTMVRVVDSPREQVVKNAEYTSGVASCAGFAPDNPVGGIEWLQDTQRCAKEDREFSWHFLLWCNRRIHKTTTHTSRITSVLWDQGRERFYFGDNQGNFGYFSSVSLDRVDFSPTLSGRINQLAMSPDRSTLACVSKSGNTVFYDLTTGERTSLELADQVKLCRLLSYSKDGSKVITLQRLGRIAVWSADDGSLVDEWDVGHKVMLGDYSRGTDSLAIAHPGGGFRIGNLGTKTWSTRLSKDVGSTTGLTFDSEGASILESNSEKGFALWNVATEEQLQQYEVTCKGGAFASLRAMDDNLWVFKEKHDGLCFVRQQENFCIARLIQCAVTAGFDLTDDGRWLAYGRVGPNDSSSDETGLGVWDLRPWEARHVLPTSGDVTDLVCADDNLVFFVGNQAGRVERCQPGQPPTSIAQLPASIRSIARAKSNDRIACCSDAEFLVMGEGAESRKKTGLRLLKFGKSDNFLAATDSGELLRTSQDEEKLLGSYSGKPIWIGEHGKSTLLLNSAGEVFQFVHQEIRETYSLGVVPSLAMLVADRLMVIGERKLLSVDLLRRTTTITDLACDVVEPRFAVSPDGKTVAFADADGTLGFLDPVVGTERCSYSNCFPGPAKRIGFSADGKIIYVLGGDDKIHVWTPFEFDK